ncbi:hypothetical protein QL285_081727 [Trifolium repens]|nr:hypothetical protein QL285_081727 [Trifolium repens]
MDDTFICVIIAPFGFGGGNPPAILEVVAGIVDPLALTPMVPELITGFELPPLTLMVGIFSEVVEFRAGLVGPPVGLALGLPDTG